MNMSYDIGSPEDPRTHEESCSLLLRPVDRKVSLMAVAALALTAMPMGPMPMPRIPKFRRANKYIADRNPNQPVYAKVQGRDRNQPCQCGSGRKFKKCCGRN